LTIFASETQEPYRAFGIVVLTGRHPPSPPRAAGQYGAQSAFCRLRLFIFNKFFQRLAGSPHDAGGILPMPPRKGESDELADG
jgi:hypothetical protein